MAYYPFQMSGQGPTFAKPYTKEGKQYFGFYTQPDGRIAFLRKEASDPDSGDMKTVGDYLDPNTKFYAQDPNVAKDPQSYKTVRDFADSKDGILPDGSYIGYAGGQHRIYPAMTYKGLKQFLDSADPKKKVSTKKKTTTMENTPTDLNAPAKYKIDKGFYESPEYKNIDTSRPAGQAFTYSPYFGMASSGAISYTDQAYKAYAKRKGFNPDEDYSSPLKYEQVAEPAKPPVQETKPMADLTEQEKVIEQKSEQAQQTELADQVKVPFSPQQIKDQELLTPKDEYMETEKELKGSSDTEARTGAVNIDEFKGVAPTKVDAQTYKATTTGDLEDMIAAQGTVSNQSEVTAAQGAASPESLVTAATEELNVKGTVKYQLAELYKSMEEGGEPPAWATPAIRKVSAMMAQRGLGSSSMASAAITQAMMESGIAIATADANKYSTLQLQNLNNKQQAAIQNATVVAGMDTANLNNRQVASVNNAKAFLSLDLQNLTNEQQANTVNFQSQVQSLLTDVAAENAASQFNAKSQNEIEEFFAELGAGIETSTLNRLSGLAEFNVLEADAIENYNVSAKSAREQFNANMRLQIDQSNAVWRRGVNTANTAGQNEVNRQNAATLLGINQQALNDLWQLYRDQASWSMKISENREDRAHNAAMQASAISNNAQAYDSNFNNFLILKTIDNIFRPTA